MCYSTGIPPGILTHKLQELEVWMVSSPVFGWMVGLAGPSSLSSLVRKLALSRHLLKTSLMALTNSELYSVNRKCYKIKFVVSPSLNELVVEI